MPELSCIPANDTHDFVTAWGNGRKGEAFKILERPSFAVNVATSPHIISKSDAKGRLATDQAELTAGLAEFATKAAPKHDVSSGAALSEALLGNLEAMPKAKSSNEHRLVENYLLRNADKTRLEQGYAKSESWPTSTSSAE